MKTCQRSDRKLGSGGLAPRKIVEDTPFRTSIGFLIDLYAEKENLIS